MTFSLHTGTRHTITLDYTRLAALAALIRSTASSMCTPCD